MRLLLFIITLLAIAPLHGATDIRRFQNNDKTKSFFAALTGYDAKTKKVTVKMKNGRTASFMIEVLSADDQKYVLANGKRLAAGNDLRLSLRKFQDKSIKKIKPRIVDRVYPSGYTITLTNKSKQAYDNITVRYTLYYEVQGYLKPERSAEKKSGTLDTKKILGRETLNLNTEKLEIVSGKLEPVIKYVNRKDADGNNYKEPVVDKPGGRRKDLLTGCKVEVLVDGDVVKSEVDGTIAVRETAK